MNDLILKYVREVTETRLSPVDVVMCTWNSNRPYFERCLKTVRREIPVHHFIVVDRFSSDDTLEVIKKYFEPVVVLTDENLARQRMAGINLVDTEYFVFVDDDVELPLGWFKRLTSCIDDSVGAVHERTTDDRISELSMLLKCLDERKWIEFSLKCSKVLKMDLITDVTPGVMWKYIGSTHGTLVKTDVVKDWHPSSHISACEDRLLMKHVVDKGYVWRIVNKFSVIHHGTPRNIHEFFKKIVWYAAGARVTGIHEYKRGASTSQLPFIRPMIRVIKQLIEAIVISVKVREPRIVLFVPVLWFIRLKAYLQWSKFLLDSRK